MPQHDPQKGVAFSLSEEFQTVLDTLDADNPTVRALLSSAAGPREGVGCLLAYVKGLDDAAAKHDSAAEEAEVHGTEYDVSHHKAWAREIRSSIPSFDYAAMVELIAAAIDPEIWEQDGPADATAGAVGSFHSRRQTSCEKARSVLATFGIKQPPEPSLEPAAPRSF